MMFIQMCIAWEFHTPHAFRRDPLLRFPIRSESAKWWPKKWQARYHLTHFSHRNLVTGQFYSLQWCIFYLHISIQTQLFIFILLYNNFRRVTVRVHQLHYGGGSVQAGNYTRKSKTSGKGVLDSSHPWPCKERQSLSQNCQHQATGTGSVYFRKWILPDVLSSNQSTNCAQFTAAHITEILVSMSITAVHNSAWCCHILALNIKSFHQLKVSFSPSWIFYRWYFGSRQHNQIWKFGHYIMKRYSPIG